MIYTFYSYKGGVGRTMALANVAELFYQAGLKVLMVDWDLEAPGLERFFPVDLEEILDKPGVMDMLLGYKERMAQELPISEGGKESLPFEKPDQFFVDIYPDDSDKGHLWLLPAGRRSQEHFAGYAHAVRTFDWQDFYQNWEGELYFEWLRQEFEQMADVVLIDSRTGVTEIGGVCTYQLADTVVMFCSPNQQSLDGTYEMARNFTDPKVQSLRRGRPLSVLIIPARVERAESELLDKFKEEFISLFEDFAPRTEGIDIQRLWELRIPYIPKYAYKEVVAVRESGRASAEDMAMAFRELGQVMKPVGLSQLSEKFEGVPDEFVLVNMPHFLSVNYQRLLEAQTASERVELILHIYNLVLRVLTISIVTQYLIRDREKVSDPYLNQLLLHRFPRMTLDDWSQLLFASLKAYEGKRDLLFMPELYDFYWDASTVPHRRRVEVEQPFERLAQVAVELKSQLLPQEEVEWEKLTEEIKDLLQQILYGAAFIGEYDLIRVLDHDELFYGFELHKGLKISTGRQPLPKYAELNHGCFYLRNGEDFLLLYPLLVFWEREPGKSNPTPTDVAVYDRFAYERVQYLLATLGKTVVDARQVKAFVTLLYDTIEAVKHERQEAEKLTWWQLRDICVDISQQRMATVRHKYRSELYLEREKTRQAFERFLQSDKRCFVLIGKSGVGKSSTSPQGL